RIPLGVPVLLVHSPDDHTVSVRRSRAYAAAARAAGGDVTLLEPPADEHRSLIDPPQEAWRTAVRALGPVAEAI
ncbi:MAG: alpha/beta hydrolase, partial [Actinomycetota bacterium]|nr:alpha/beta hydrolase [Actinomycetota bacterium]